MTKLRPGHWHAAPRFETNRERHVKFDTFGRREMRRAIRDQANAARKAGQ